MKAYIIITGIVFGLLVVAHVWRAIAEGPQILHQPWFDVITLAAAALFVWAMCLLRGSRQRVN